MENKFKFKKGDLEIEFSGEKDFVENQITFWKSFIENNKENDNSLGTTEINDVIKFNENSELINTINLDEVSKTPFDLSSIDSINDSENNQKETSTKTENIIPSIKNFERGKFKVKKNIEIDDFIKLKNPTNDADKIIVGAYFFEKYEKKDSYSEIDINNLLNIDNSENLLVINVEKGFLTELKNNSDIHQYSLTYSGEMYVKGGLNE